MLTPVPEEFPVLEDAKFYLCDYDTFFDLTPADGCEQAFVGQVSCCFSGADIKAWRAAGNECKEGFPMCILIGTTSQRIVSTHGPYDTIDACELDL